MLGLGLDCFFDLTAPVGPFCCSFASFVTLKTVQVVTHDHACIMHPISDVALICVY